MQDATRVFSELHTALKRLNVTEELRARNLLSQAHVISFDENLQMAAALSTLRAVFNKLDNWEIRHPSN